MGVEITVNMNATSIMAFHVVTVQELRLAYLELFNERSKFYKEEQDKCFGENLASITGDIKAGLSTVLVPDCISSAT